MSGVCPRTELGRLGRIAIERNTKTVLVKRMLRPDYVHDTRPTKVHKRP